MAMLSDRVLTPTELRALSARSNLLRNVNYPRTRIGRPS